MTVALEAPNLVAGHHGSTLRQPPRLHPRRAWIVSHEKTLYDDRAEPYFADPSQVLPGNDSLRQRGRNIHEFQWPFTGENNVLQLGHSAVDQKRRQLPRVSENI